MVLTGLFYLLLAACSSALLAIFLRAFQSETDNRYGILLGNYLTCIVLGFLLMPQKVQIFHPERTTAICGLVSGILFIVSLVLVQTSIHENGAILTAAFSRLGLIVPLVISIFWGGERPSLLQWVGIVLVFAAMYFINQGAEEENEEGNNPSQKSKEVGVLLLTLVLLVMGITDTMSKVFERIGSREQDTLYIFYVFLVAGILALNMLIREYKSTGKRVTWKNLLGGVCVGVPNYFSTSLLLQALVRLPAFIAYPGFATGAILIVTVVSALVFKEKPGKMKRIGLGIILAAIILLNI